MVMKMKIKVMLPRVRTDREITNETSSFLCKTNRDLRYSLSRRDKNHFGEITFNAGRSSSSKKTFHENRYWNIFAYRMYDLFVRTHDNAKSNEMTWITFRYSNGDSSVMLRKDGSSIFMNGVKKNQNDIAIALAKIIAFGAHNRDAQAMNAYIERNVTYSANVLYALENRTPYWLFVDGTQHNVKINTTLISRDEVAFEVSENVWGSLSLDDANTFIDCYRHNSKRSRKWANISPSNLWFNMFSNHATDDQEALMKAWLMQNRTDVIVEERAFHLLQDMDKNYDEFTLVDLRKEPFSTMNIAEKSNTLNFAMHVKGSLGDWLVYPNSRSSGTQRCKALFFQSKDTVNGPFCIDDINGKNVVGDQIATRAMLLKSDTVAKSMVSTLRDIGRSSFRIPDRQLKKAKFTEKLTWR
jgi:hypothetical protein